MFAPPVTIESEVKRGMDAVNAAPFTPMEFNDFITATESSNKQRNTDTEPFRFGLYYMAWHRAWRSASIGYPTKLKQEFWEVIAKVNHAAATALAKHLGFAPEQIADLAGNSFVPDEAILFPRIAKSGKFKGSMHSVSDEIHDGYLRDKRAAAVK